MSDTGFTAKQAGAECALGNLGKLGSIGVACVVSSKPSGDGGTQPRAKAWNTQAVPWHGRGSCNGARCQPARMASSATVAWCARPPAARPKASCRNMGRKLLGKAAMGKAGGTRDAIGKVDLMAAAAPKIPDAVFPRCLRSPCNNGLAYPVMRDCAAGPFGQRIGGSGRPAGFTLPPPADDAPAGRSLVVLGSTHAPLIFATCWARSHLANRLLQVTAYKDETPRVSQCHAGRRARGKFWRCRRGRVPGGRPPHGIWGSRYPMGPGVLLPITTGRTSTSRGFPLGLSMRRWRWTSMAGRALEHMASKALEARRHREAGCFRPSLRDLVV